MTNIDNFPNFVESTLKVTASNDIDVEKDLAATNDSNKSIDTLLAENNDEKKE